jgi:hypothetical protein
VSDPANPKFSGIALPDCVQWLEKEKSWDEKGQAQVIKMKKILPPLDKL